MYMHAVRYFYRSLPQQVININTVAQTVVYSKIHVFSSVCDCIIIINNNMYNCSNRWLHFFVEFRCSLCLSHKFLKACNFCVFTLYSSVHIYTSNRCYITQAQRLACMCMNALLHTSSLSCSTTATACVPDVGGTMRDNATRHLYTYCIVIFDGITCMRIDVENNVCLGAEQFDVCYFLLILWLELAVSKK